MLTQNRLPSSAFQKPKPTVDTYTFPSCQHMICQSCQLPRGGMKNDPCMHGAGLFSGLRGLVGPFLVNICKSWFWFYIFTCLNIHSFVLFNSTNRHSWVDDLVFGKWSTCCAVVLLYVALDDFCVAFFCGTIVETSLYMQRGPDLCAPFHILALRWLLLCFDGALCYFSSLQFHFSRMTTSQQNAQYAHATFCHRFIHAWAFVCYRP